MMTTHSTTPTATADLHARGLVKTYGPVTALGGVDLTVPSGQALAIMGPSGSGKSTLLHCLSGILPPDAGEVTLGDATVSRMSDARRSRLRRERFGFVFQDGQLLPELPARENVALPLLLNGANRNRALGTAEGWLERLGLAGMGKRRPGEMSGGQAQRVAIARALVHGPQVVFADEPTGALDQATGHEVMQMLTTATRMTGATLVLVTHDRKVAGWCSRLIEIRDALIHADHVIEGDAR
ncbi:MAG: ABC transporter ATP-binding protein [Mobilicoccus sp.]|nr:ABC transporter ATP-binding protein [Mobilicoccus sp.]